MQTVLTTDEAPSGNTFDPWCERLRERYFPIEGSRDEDGPFQARLEVSSIGNMTVNRFTQTGSSRYTIRDNVVRKKNLRDDTLTVSLRTRGVAHTLQHDRTSIQRPGDIVIREVGPLDLHLRDFSQDFNLGVPRHKIENLLGNAKIYTSLTLEAEQASTSLVTSFFAELIRIRHELSPDTAARMTSIGVDLIVAGMADRLAREVPRSLHGTLVVQRAKAYVEAQIGDPTLDPAQLAAAMGVSLRRLQELFKEQGRQIAEWIWERRLNIAAGRLSDRGSAHRQIADLAYGCGFSSQSHFSRRFKDRFGMTPRDYREHARLRTDA